MKSSSPASSPTSRGSAGAATARQARSTLVSALTVASIIVVGALATFEAWVIARNGVERDIESAVTEQSRARANDVQNVLALVQESILGVGAHLAAAGTDAGFQTFASKALARHEAIAAIGWVQAASPAASDGPVIVDGQPVTRRDWLDNFVPVEAKASYRVLLKIATRDGSSEAGKARRAFLGFDFSSDERWRAVMDRADGTGALQVSFTGLTGNDSLLMLPVRSESGSLLGHVIAAVSLSDLMGRGLSEGGAGLLNRVFDDSDRSGLKMLYPAANAATPAVADVSDSERERQRALTRRTGFKVLGGQWLVETEPSVTFLRERSSRLPMLVLVMGSALTLLMAAYVAALRSQNRKVQHLVAQRTAELDKAHRDLRDTEMIAMQSEKMSSLGQMVASVAHEINTPLGFVSSNLQMLQGVVAEMLPALRRQMRLMQWVVQWSRLSTDQKRRWYAVAVKNNQALSMLEDRQVLSDATELVEESLVGLERISEIVVSLKDFSRVDRAQVDDVDIHHCIDSTLVIAHNVIKNKAEVIKDYGTLPHVTCSPSQINQVILNMVTNSAQAIEDQGHIWIKTYARDGKVFIDIRDDGPGIAPEVLPRLFEPFFTTKEAGKGTGLGLSISEKIVKSHGGEISVASSRGAGTTFTIALPARRAVTPGAPEAARPMPARALEQKVLLEEVA